jgi:hypothetical protein
MLSYDFPSHEQQYKHAPQATSELVAAHADIKDPGPQEQRRHTFQLDLQQRTWPL